MIEGVSEGNSINFMLQKWKFCTLLLCEESKEINP